MNFDNILEFVVENGPWILFLLVAVENIGIPGYPGGWMLLAIGAFSKMGIISFTEGFIIAMLATVSAITLVYFISYKFGDVCIHLFEKNPKFIAAYERMQSLTEKYGSVSLILLRLIPVVRVFVSVIAGMLMMPFRQYIIYSIIGSGLFTFGSMAIGYLAAGTIA